MRLRQARKIAKTHDMECTAYFHSDGDGKPHLTHNWHQWLTATFTVNKHLRLPVMDTVGGGKPFRTTVGAMANRNLSSVVRRYGFK